MKGKVLKTLMVILLLITLTMANFIYVSESIISYAGSDSETNHKNVEFTVNLKDGNILNLGVLVKNEGYLNGEISIENSNFKLKSSDNKYVNKVEENKLTLNQINASEKVQIDVEIEPIKDELFNIGLLSKKTNINLNAIYRDSSEKDIKIKSTKEVKLEYTYEKENNIENDIKLITNKIMTVNGEDKRVIQLSMDMGLKANQYPVKEINSEVILPETGENLPTVIAKANFNTMTNFKYEYDGKNNVKLNFTNEPNQENKVVWKKQGTENVILTLIYDKDVKIEERKITSKENVKLYDESTLTLDNTIAIDNQEKEEIIQISATNTENAIYKGKLTANIERNIESKVEIAVNLANVGTGINLKEEASQYKIEEERFVSSNIVYNKTILSKSNFDEILGQNGTITILNQDGEILTVITNATPVDENGNIVIDYAGKDVKAIEMKTSVPVKEGNLKITHIKTIKQENENVVKNATEINTKITANYGTEKNIEKEVKTILEKSTTETILSTNRDTLSTVIDNNIELRATLKSNHEKYNLYKNPSLTFELPEAVESAEITGINLIYETELKIKDYKVNGKTIIVNLEGTQTQYKEEGIEGAILILNANLKLNKKASTQDSKIVMNCTNNNETNAQEVQIKVVAPTDMTVIHNINNLGVETIGQEEISKTTLEKGQNSKKIETEIEIINNNENTVQNIKVIGTFPTKNTKNNIDIKILEKLNIKGKEAKVYYTENEEATDDLQNENNGWDEEIKNANLVKKYLIVISEMKAGESLQATYKTEIPALLEYNQQAEQGYTVNYENTLTKTSNQIKATTIKMETGIGPKVETKVSASLMEEQLTDTSTVKNGEVIKYKVQVSNTGSEDIKDITVQGTVPEGTVLVEPEPNYEYTGSSYYKELDSKTFETKIDTLKVGEVATKEYEVRVKSDTVVGTKLISTGIIKYGEAIKEAKSVQVTTEKGNIRVTVKRITDRNIDLYESGVVQYYAIIENISNTKQENVKVKTNLPEALSVSRLTLITNLPSQEMGDGDLHRATDHSEVVEQNNGELQDETNNLELPKVEEIEYKEELNIGSIEPGQNKVLSYDMKIDKLKNTDILNFGVKAIADNTEYNSNQTQDNVKKANISITMTANPETQYVKAGDKIEYTIKVKNNGKHSIEDIVLKDSVPKALTVNQVTVDDKEVTELKERNNIEMSLDMSEGSEMTIKIEAVVNYSESRTEAEPISNVAYIEVLAEKVATTSEINHIIEANENSNIGNNNGDNNENNNTDNNIDNNDVAKGKALVTGTAWFDENVNGQKDDNEKLLSGIKVRLYNTETNNLVKNKDGKILEAVTNDSGVYVLNNIGSGKYIVIFDYNKTEYALTKYKVSGIAQNKNSSAMMKELTIEGNRQQVASTDIMEITDKNISDINIGLTKLQNFDLKLEKFVSKIIIRNSAGSTVKEYDDETLAKAELDAKKLNGSTVLIEYKIRITNLGEVDGYVRKVADYMPSDLKFSSELNKDWYQTSEGLYNASIANDKILAGQSKELTLTLTKTMTENNVGRINNTAEIAEAYNDLGLIDSNSTPGNKAQGENDYGSADVILSIKTGGALYIGIGITAVAILAIVAVVIIKLRKNKEEKI